MNILIHRADGRDKVLSHQEQLKETHRFPYIVWQSCRALAVLIEKEYGFMSRKDRTPTV